MIDAVVFYGVVPSDGEDGESFARPWRMTRQVRASAYRPMENPPRPPKMMTVAYECDDGDALDMAQGLDVVDYASGPRHAREKDARVTDWHKRLETRRDRRARPVEFIRFGRNENLERYVLAVRDSVSRATNVGVGWTAPAPPDYDANGWPCVLDDWATRLGIPKERRGEPGWFAIDMDHVMTSVAAAAFHGVTTF